MVAPDGEVVGVDSSDVAVAAARARAGEAAATGRPAGVPGGVRFERADVTELPFEDGSFDAVRADRVLLHVARPVVAAHQLVRVTRAGGRVVLTEGRLAGVQWLPAGPAQEHGAPGERTKPREEQESGDVLPALPLILEHLGVTGVTVERSDSDVELGEDASAVIGIRPGLARLSIVHIHGTVG